MTKALTFAEDLCLLLQDNASGDLYPLEGRTLDFGLATATLLELAHHDRIDTDLDNLLLVDPTPLDDPIADPALALIAGNSETLNPGIWIRRIGLQLGSQILDAALNRLCERGILERDPGDNFFLSPVVAHAKRYPGVEGDSAEEVKVRVMRILFREEIPHPWEADLIGLASACRVFEKVLSPRELDCVDARVEEVESLNLLCRAGRIAIDEDLEASRIAPQQRYKPIPKAPGLPLLGNALGMTGDLNAFFTKRYRRHGPIFRIRLPGRRIVVLAGREANSFVLRHARTHLRSNREFSGFCRAMETDRAMISMDGADHVRLRRVAQAGYSRAVIERDIDQAIKIARHHVSSWSVGPRLRAFETIQRIVTEQVGVLATGLLPREYFEDLKYFFDSLVFTVRRDRPRFMYAHRMPRVRGRIRELCAKVVELHHPDLRKGCPHDVVDAFLELHRKDPQFLPETDLMSAMVGPYIAAMDTVAGTLSFAVLRLFSEPGYLEMLRAEADALFANGMPNARDVRALANTHAFVTEALRCYPTVPVMMRTVCNGFEFQGHWVPAGTSLMVATTVVHRDPEHYPDPDRFEIERHLPPRKESKQRGAFAPFGIGPHTCLGGAFAQVQMATVIATMLRYGEFERDPAPEDGVIRATGYPSYRPHRQVGFRLVRRRNEVRTRGSTEPEAQS
ncbi:MAG: cytochrome P450 [Bryobacterales bacterium]|nr:cytochrome P450 [Bryobacterales bacterium]MDE0625389.1 cytochrome P450 [Bryobacterales bacterium]